MQARVLLNEQKLEVITRRLCQQLIEHHGNFENTAIIGLQPRGVLYARMLHREVCEQTRNPHILYGDLDTTFYRDDFRRGNDIPEARSLHMPFNLEGLNVVLVDDVLYTGRSVRAALDALNDFGRPARVQLLVLIDRRYSRELPLQPDFTGYEVDSRANQKVKVDWNATEGHKVWLLENVTTA